MSAPAGRPEYEMPAYPSVYGFALGRVQGIREERERRGEDFYREIEEALCDLYEGHLVCALQMSFDIDESYFTGTRPDVRKLVKNFRSIQTRLRIMQDYLEKAKGVAQEAFEKIHLHL